MPSAAFRVLSDLQLDSLFQAVLHYFNVDLQQGLMPRITALAHQVILEAINSAGQYAAQLILVLIFLAFLLLYEGRPSAEPQRNPRAKTEGYEIDVASNGMSANPLDEAALPKGKTWKEINKQVPVAPARVPSPTQGAI